VIEEAAGAGGTDGIHTEVSDYAISDDDNLAILPSNLNDGLHFRMVEKSGCRMTGDLIFD
jgi:hypothetical protein